MIGILCEKPSAARNFAKALGGNSGSFKGENYRIVSSVGHLYEFVSPSNMVDPSLKEKYASWDIGLLPWNETDFTWKKVQKDKTKDVIANIRKGLTGCDEICIATDVDPTGEGELLAWEILDALKLRPRRWSRMYHDDETPKSIQSAFASRKTLTSMADDMDYVKADFRSKWDFCSMQWTRIATTAGDGKSILRQGRLKSAMVLLVGDALKALAEYKEVPFYQNRFKDENGVIYTNKDEPTYPSEADVPPCPYKPSTVTLDDKEIKRTYPPKLLDLAALSARLAPKGYSADEVLKTYQKMYEDHIVSYPRTEDKFISPEQFKEMAPLVDSIAKVVGINTSDLTHRTPRTTHVKTGGSHGANRPGTTVPKSLGALSSYGPSASAIYEILAKNFLAMYAEDYIYEKQTGHVTDYPKFVGTANVPKSMGWKAIFDSGDAKDEDENAKGLGTKAEPFIYRGVNKKPPVPTMKWLMKQLEKHDVGTGATRTSIYADVINAKAKFPLLKETKGKLSMTPYGEMSYKLLPGTHIGDIKITERLQSQMRGVAKGELDPDECIKEIRTMIEEDIKTMTENGKNIDKSSAQQKEKYTGTWNGQEVSFNRVWSGHRFTDEECEKLCDGEFIEVRGLTSAKGTTYGVKGHLENLEYNGYKYVGFKNTEFLSDSSSNTSGSTGMKCPVCGRDMFISAKGFVLCKGLFEKDASDTPACDFRFNSVIAGKKLSEAQIKALVNKGQTPKISGFKSKSGNTFAAVIYIDENHKTAFKFD